MSVYYNEYDAKIAAWLRQLIVDGLLPEGDVDERSIEDVTPADLAGYTQHHFFAGIGGWPLALQLAGWPGDRPIWTGSCPCQPFSTAGKGAGFADERHLWPAWQWLVEQCRPSVVVGEQVARGGAKPWLDLVCDDLEGMGYAFGAQVLPACSVGAPHLRERLFWVGVANKNGREPGIGSATATRHRGAVEPTDCGVGHASGQRPPLPKHQNTAGEGRRIERRSIERSGVAGWTDGEWRVGSDGKTRAVKPGVPLLAHGVPARVVRISGYGNAIVPQVAARFIENVMTTIDPGDRW